MMVVFNTKHLKAALARASLQILLYLFFSCFILNSCQIEFPAWQTFISFIFFLIIRKCNLLLKPFLREESYLIGLSIYIHKRWTIIILFYLLIIDNNINNIPLVFQNVIFMSFMKNFSLLQYVLFSLRHKYSYT